MENRKELEYSDERSPRTPPRRSFEDEDEEGMPSESYRDGRRHDEDEVEDDFRAGRLPQRRSLEDDYEEEDRKEELKQREEEKKQEDQKQEEELKEIEEVEREPLLQKHIVYARQRSY